jgi:hypothetical protein
MLQVLLIAVNLIPTDRKTNRQSLNEQIRSLNDPFRHAAPSVAGACHAAVSNSPSIKQQAEKYWLQSPKRSTSMPGTNCRYHTCEKRDSKATAISGCLQKIIWYRNISSTVGI